MKITRTKIESGIKIVYEIDNAELEELRKKNYLGLAEQIISLNLIEQIKQGVKKE